MSSNNIENLLLQALEISSKTFHNDEKVKEFEQACSDFQKLVESGLVKNRGYNLVSSDEAYETRLAFNVK